MMYAELSATEAAAPDERAGDCFRSLLVEGASNGWVGTRQMVPTSIRVDSGVRRPLDWKHTRPYEPNRSRKASTASGGMRSNSPFGSAKACNGATQSNEN